MNKLEEVQNWRGKKVVDADGQLSPDQERQMWEHYGRSDYDEWQPRTARRRWTCPTTAVTSSARLRQMVVTMGRRRSWGCGRLRRVIVVAPSPSVTDPDQVSAPRA
jgi:hypothetical protein